MGADVPDMASTWTADDDRLLTVLYQGGIEADEAGRILHRSPAAVRTRLRTIGVSGTPKAEADTRPRKMCPGCGNYFDSKAKTCSQTCGAKVRSRRNRGRSNGRGARAGKRADLGDLFVRSRWEANYARYLNHLEASGEIHGWEYEPQVFEFPVKRGNTSYTPDFRVWLTETEYEWHEVKGWMDKDSRIKLERFERHHPQEADRLQLIDKAAYSELESTWGDELVGWELL